MNTALQQLVCFFVAMAIGFYGAMAVHTAYLKVTCCAPAKVTHSDAIRLRDWRTAQ